MREAVLSQVSSAMKSWTMLQQMVTVQQTTGGEGVSCTIYTMNGQLIVASYEAQMYLAQPPASLPFAAPMEGCPTPSLLPVQEISKGSLIPR